MKKSKYYKQIKVNHKTNQGIYEKIKVVHKKFR